MKLRAANLAEKLLVEVTRLLLVLIEQLPVAEARLARFTFVFALLDHGLLGRLVVRLLVLDELLIAEERVAA